MKNKSEKIILVIILLVVITIIIIAIQLLKKQNVTTNTENTEELAPVGASDIVETSVNELSSKTVLEVIMTCLDNSYIKEAYEINSNEMCAYIVCTRNNKVEKYYIIYLDFINYTFENTEITQQDYNNLKNGKVDEKYIKTIDIKETDNNTFTIANMDDAYISEFYYANIKYLIVNDPEEMYSRLDETYKQARFPDYTSFAEYCQEMKDKFSNASLIKYSKDNNAEEETYICTDSNSQVITISIKNAADYTVKLDNYTTETEEFKTKYESATAQTKVTTNVEKFMKMLNNADYESAYNLLDETYKKNNFPTQASFETYVQNNIYNIYTIDGISEQGSYYVITLTTKDRAAASALTKKCKIIMALGEGTSFKISFAQ